ncbi:type I restriction-modification enzyme R subunit C-terminal domain-containing protein [Rudaea cellulosilytica]|uniref:type I restriction endonuclease subunit R n=1 Tax=Rudaea cellulosilytica TaxID=540746 RepID=UPI000372F1C4|nr:type I restriction-modification enzyme R subunit C-terminal domain-containing protein [Rudaea cellulosilytica]
MTQTPEQRAREQIDAQLAACGWFVQSADAVDFTAGRGIAIREARLKTGPCDYLLLVDRKPVGVIEAKKQGTTLSGVAEQSAVYAANIPTYLAAGVDCPLPFAYESTGVETFFRDQRDPEPRSRPIFAFHRPETLADWASEPDTLRTRLKAMPTTHPLVTSGMRDCQIEAIKGLEQSLAENRPRALIHMATGAGKTFTACAFAYRLIKYAKARRILFLVDRSNLGEQATGEFHSYRTPDTDRKFTDLYNVQHLKSQHIDDVCKVTICTIQRLYSILRGEDLAEGADDLSGAELAAALGTTRTKDVAYNPAVPIEKFDFIITDECHRSIYNLWRQVLEYFDGFLIGLTATPALQTIAYFHQNRVAEYNHERAVADGVNVGYDVYRIKTKVTEAGGKVEKGLMIDHRSKASRRKRQDALADDLDYTPADLDRSVVVPDQICTILNAYRDVVQTELFPGRALVPKTLIFAKDDSHAEDIVHICREVFGKGNDFCKKITYQAKHPVTGKPADTEQLIREFCLSPTLRIAVTVDMIATGTDVKPLEVLIFLRDVRSRVYFEQMKGRGTRVLTPTDLQAVSGEDARAKTHFVIVDAVGVCESDKTESRPLDREPSLPLKTLLQRVIFPGGRDEDTLTTLAARLARLDRELEPTQRQQIAAASGGHTPATLSGALLRAYDPDAIAERATGTPSADPESVTPQQFEATRQQLIIDACAPFDKPALRQTLETLKKETEQALDIYTPDEVLSQGFDEAAKTKAAGLVQEFRDYLAQHQTQIDALQILYSRPFKQRLTESMLKELEGKLRDKHAAWTEDRIWDAFAVTTPAKVKGRTQAGRFADLVSLVRFALEQQPVLAPFADSVAERFNQWLKAKADAGTSFSAEQLAWLELIRDHIATSLSIEAEDFDYSPFSQRGGLGKVHQLFGEQLPKLLDELNEALAA